jgi:hypothetical protein
MIPKMPVPDLIRDGSRFSEKIMFNELSHAMQSAPAEPRRFETKFRSNLP